jgi:predicted MPP superfamily phosphohydrolase
VNDEKGQAAGEPHDPATPVIPTAGDEAPEPSMEDRGGLGRVRSARRIFTWRGGRIAARSTAAAIPRWLLRIGLPLLLVGAMLHSWPYHATVQGVPLQVQATVFTRPGFSADTTVGDWEFPAVDGLPFGVHVAPVNVDVLQLSASASADPAAYAKRLQTGVERQLPTIIAWLLGETILGIGLGLAAAAAINMSIRYLRKLPRRDNELAHRAWQLGAATAAVVVVAGYGAASYNRDWLHQSRLTGTLAAAQLFPDQLSSYYTQQSKVYDVLGSIAGIQSALQNQIGQNKLPNTALRIMFISDIHLAAVYPLVGQYAANYHVNLIINTGDETEFGTTAELTPDFTAAIAAVTKTTPMLWLAGNHDSPAVESVMSTIPGVTVLGSKQSTATGYSVTASTVNAFGLTIAGVPDPRVYGGPGPYGADDTKITDPLEQKAMDTAVAAIAKTKQQFDIFATHEPVAADQLRHDLPDRIRQTNSGHLHAQNATGDIQHGNDIDLVEGSTGAGGLDNIVRGVNRPPIEFSIESVAADCEFTQIVRFQIRTPQVPTADQPAAYGDDVTASTVYFSPQKLTNGDRTCSASLGVTSPQ